MTVEHLRSPSSTPKVREILRACEPMRPAARNSRVHRADDSRLTADDDRRCSRPWIPAVLQRAVFHVQSSGKKEVSVANVLVAIFSEKHSHAAYLLTLHDVYASRRRQYISTLAQDRDDAERVTTSRARRGRTRGRGQLALENTRPTSTDWRAKAASTHCIAAGSSRADDRILCRRARTIPCTSKAAVARPRWSKRSRG